MKNCWYVALCLSSSLKGAVEIENKSSLPFRITQLVYEQNDGLSKTPKIDFMTETLAPYSNMHLDSRKMITELSGVHAGKAYTFKFSPTGENLILISADNKVMLLGPPVAREYSLDIDIPENYKPITRL